MAGRGGKGAEAQPFEVCHAAFNGQVGLGGGQLRVPTLRYHWHHNPLFAEIVHRAHEAGLAGATVLQASKDSAAGAGSTPRGFLSLSEELPVVITIVDSNHRTRDLLPQLEELVTDALVILDDCTVIRYLETNPRNLWPHPHRHPGHDW